MGDDIGYSKGKAPDPKYIDYNNEEEVKRLHEEVRDGETHPDITPNYPIGVEWKDGFGYCSFVLFLAAIAGIFVPWLRPWPSILLGVAALPLFLKWHRSP